MNAYATVLFLAAFVLTFVVAAGLLFRLVDGLRLGKWMTVVYCLLQVWVLAPLVWIVQEFRASRREEREQS